MNLKVFMREVDDQVHSLGKTMGNSLQTGKLLEVIFIQKIMYELVEKLREQQKGNIIEFWEEVSRLRKQVEKHDKCVMRPTLEFSHPT